MPGRTIPVLVLMMFLTITCLRISNCAVETTAGTESGREINTQQSQTGKMENSIVQFTESQRQDLRKILELNDPYFNEKINLLGGAKNPHTIHTTLPAGTPVHRTRESAVYAVACLDSGEDWRRDRAVLILEALLKLQDQDPKSPTCGVWPWYYEEPISKMNPPDYNWADFMGVQLITVALNYQDRLTVGLQTRIREAVILASKAIIRRNVSMDYTNVALLGSYVTTIAGQVYDMPRLKSYGLDRIDRFYNRTMQNGGFPEYNSPTYTVIALMELGRLLHDLKDPDAFTKVNEVYEMLWSDIATHYHLPTREWAGPHSRAYSTFNSGGLAMLLYLSLPDNLLTDVPKPEIKSRDQLYDIINGMHAPTPCPERFHGYFRDTPVSRNVEQTFVKSNAPAIGYTRVTPAYSLASINSAIMWDQRRNLVGYWNYTSKSEKPSALQLRFLHDDYDFSSANVLTAQNNGAVLVGINLATDGGDRHCNLDIIKDGKVEAADLRLRLQLYNIPTSLELPQLTFGQATVLKLGQVNLTVRIDKASFGQFTPALEVTRSSADVFLDVVLYHGERRVFNLKEMENAYIVMCLTLWDSSETQPQPDPVTIENDQEHMVVQWIPYPGQSLSLRLFERPVPYGQIRWITGLNASR